MNRAEQILAAVVYLPSIFDGFFLFLSPARSTLGALFCGQLLCHRYEQTGIGTWTERLPHHSNWWKVNVLYMSHILVLIGVIFYLYHEMVLIIRHLLVFCFGEILPFIVLDLVKE